jgi:deoxyribodipyrimidine photo-lyase
MTVPATRIRILNDGAVNAGGDYVLYWMIASRRTTWNFALDRAIELSRELAKPVLVLEALRCDYRWASDRLHRFVIDGMADNAISLEDTAVTYYPYVEPSSGESRGLLEALATHACCVVTDYFPAFFLPRAVATASERLPVRLEEVDSNGLLPLSASDDTFTTAYSFRRFLQKTLPDHLPDRPDSAPLASSTDLRLKAIPSKVRERWPPASPDLLDGTEAALSAIEIDRSVRPTGDRGGMLAAKDRLDKFVTTGLDSYADRRTDMEEERTSRLSPYLHFGHISAHEVFDRIVESQHWSPGRLADEANGKRSGWWGMSVGAEAFLDQIITWRELGFNFCHTRDDHDRLESLPDWALKTLREHSSDPRSQVYSLEDFEAANTHDEVWNAAQRQLVEEGRIHNYLRMLWGKKILEWTSSPQEALDVIIHLNNKYALDGRDPNSYSGIFWCLGRYDRAWGPERPIFGKVRYMSSSNAKRKLRLTGYLEKYERQDQLN